MAEGLSDVRPTISTTLTLISRELTRWQNATLPFSDSAIQTFIPFQEGGVVANIHCVGGILIHAFWNEEEREMSYLLVDSDPLLAHLIWLAEDLGAMTTVMHPEI
jgi:hypothetical protein